MKDWIFEANQIKGLDPAWRQKAKTRLREQTRPEGSLGVLESFLERLVAIQKMEKPDTRRKRILIFAADHGVAEEGVSLYPKEVTKAMVVNFLNGGATVNALARQIHAEVLVVDIGVDADFGNDPRLIHAKIGRGTRNLARESAMTEEQFERAMNTGWQLVHQAKDDGIHLLALGEMGIGNTTAASCVIAAMTERSAEEVAGRGTGLNDAQLAHKTAVIQKALNLHRTLCIDPCSVLRQVGGFEIAAMTGAILAAARLNIPVVVDGWIVSASVLAAVHLNPAVLDYLFFAHQSEEKGHRALLQSLEVQPILNLSMRLGEASGAAFAMGILDAAVRVYNETATFKEAQVAGKKEPETFSDKTS